MIRWRFYEPNPFRDMLDQMLQESRRGVRETLRGEPMPVNVHETEDAVIVEAILPGVKPEDVEVHCSEGILTISARTEVEERDYFHQEFRSLEYHRQLALPADSRWDAAAADLEQGVLTIRIPKTKPKAPEKIRIAVSRKNAGGAPIEATKGEGYSELPPNTKPKPKPRPHKPAK